LNNSSSRDEETGIDAITGATSTSRAVVNILNDFINELISKSISSLEVQK